MKFRKLPETVIKEWRTNLRGAHWFHGLGREVDKCHGTIEYDNAVDIAGQTFDPPGSESF